MGALTTWKAIQGPAIGTTGTGVSGPGTVIATVQAGKWLGTVSARLRSRLISASIQSGSVLVQVALVRGTWSGPATEATDAIDDAPALWAGARYVSTARGATWHPNILASEDCVLVARVWNRDDLDSSRRIVVDVAVTSGERPVPGAESGHELGDFRPGTGTIRGRLTANPAAGAEISYAVPIGTRVRLLHARAQLVTDGTAATRVPVLTVTCVTTHGWAPPYGHAASLTITYDWQEHFYTIAGAQFANSLGSGFGQVLLGAGGIIATATANMVAGDNWGAGSLLCEEWIVPEVAAS